MNTKKQLQNIVSVLSTVIGKSNILPVLENVKLENGTISGSSLENTIQMPFIFSGENILIDFKTFKDIVKTWKFTGLSFNGTKKEDQFFCVITTDSGQTVTIPAYSTEDFPVVPEVNSNETDLNSEHFRGLINGLNYVSKDELRPAMTGVYINSKAIVSTDAHRLYKLDICTENLPKDGLIIPSEAIKALSKIKPVQGKMYCNKQNSVFLFPDGTKLTTRNIDANYPDYEAVIPTNNKIVAKTTKETLENAINTVLFAANKTTYHVIFNFLKSLFYTHTQDIDFNTEAKCESSCSLENSELFQIAVNGKFMLDYLKTLPKLANVQLTFSTHTRAIIAKTEKENELVLIMPVMAGWDVNDRTANVEETFANSLEYCTGKKTIETAQEVETIEAETTHTEIHTHTEIEALETEFEEDIEEDEIDLFEHTEQLPAALREYLENFGEVNNYIQCEALLKVCEDYGYTFDYYLNAEPYNLRKIEHTQENSEAINEDLHTHTENDLFEHRNLLPEALKIYLDKLNECRDYKHYQEIEEKCKEFGYTFAFYSNGKLHHLRKMEHTHIETAQDIENLCETIENSLATAKVDTHIAKLQSKREKLEIRLQKAKERSQKTYNNLGWGSGMRKTKLVSYALENEIRDKIKDIDKQISEFQVLNKPFLHTHTKSEFSPPLILTISVLRKKKHISLSKQPNMLTDEQKSEILKLFHTHTHTQKSIAETVKCSEMQVQNYLAKQGLTGKRKYVDYQAIKKDIDKGMDRDKLLKKHNIVYSTLQKIKWQVSPTKKKIVWTAKEEKQLLENHKNKVPAHTHIKDRSPTACRNKLHVLLNSLNVKQ